MPVSSLDLFLPLSFDRLQYPELLLGDVSQRDRQPHTLRVQETEASPHKRAVRRVQSLVEPVLRTARPVADVDSLPFRAASWASVEFRERRVAALPAAEDAVGAVFFTSTERPLLKHRPDQEANARIFRPVAGRGYSGSSSASIASCAMTSDTAADLWTIGTAPA